MIYLTIKIFIVVSPSRVSISFILPLNSAQEAMTTIEFDARALFKSCCWMRAPHSGPLSPEHLMPYLWQEVGEIAQGGYSIENETEGKTDGF